MAYTTIGGRKVGAALKKATERISLPKIITVDNSFEFAGKLLDQRAYGHGIELDLSAKANP